MKQKASEMIQRFGSVFEHCIQVGYRHWFERNRDELSIHRGRTRSCFVWDCIIDELRSALSGDRKFHFIDLNGTTYIAYDQCFLIKVKKLNRSLRTSNVRTDSSERFNRQLALGFGETLTHVYLGYVPDNLNTRVEQIHLTCPCGDDVAWSIPVLTESTYQPALEFPARVQPAAPSKRRIRPKTSRERSVASDET